MLFAKCHKQIYLEASSLQPLFPELEFISCFSRSCTWPRIAHSNHFSPLIFLSFSVCITLGQGHGTWSERWSKITFYLSDPSAGWEWQWFSYAACSNSKAALDPIKGTFSSSMGLWLTVLLDFDKADGIASALIPSPLPHLSARCCLPQSQPMCLFVLVFHSLNSEGFEFPDRVTRLWHPKI